MHRRQNLWGLNQSAQKTQYWLHFLRSVRNHKVLLTKGLTSLLRIQRENPGVSVHFMAYKDLVASKYAQQLSSHIVSQLVKELSRIKHC